MRISTALLLSYLKSFSEPEVTGPVSEELTLERPLILREGDETLKDNQLFIISGDRHLYETMEKRTFGKGTVLLFTDDIGSDIPLLRGDITVIFLRNNNRALYEVSDGLHRLYSRLDQWERDLQHALDTDTDLNNMLKIGEEIIGNPMKIIGPDYHCLAYSTAFDDQDHLAAFRPKEKYSTDQIAIVIDNQQIAHNLRGVLSYTIEGMDLHSINLFEQKRYIGSLTIYYAAGKPDPAVEALEMYFADYIQRMLTENRMLSSDREHILRNVFMDALNKNAIDDVQAHYLQLYSTNEEGYLCLRVLASDVASQTLSVRYLCSRFETVIPGSIALYYKSSVVVLIRVRKPFSKESSIIQVLYEELEAMQLKGALSDVFSDVRQIRRYYRQASIAIELGVARRPDRRLYCFDEYVLQYLISHSVGEFSTQLFQTDGLKLLMQHDKETMEKDTAGAVSYIETLRVYLENNMNLSRAAEELFIHKTSLLARLEKIRKLLQMDLDDPDVRLRLMIVLKQMEYEDDQRAD